MRGLLCIFWKSSSDRAIPNCCTLKASAPTCDWIASFTVALRPWTSDTTVMIDVTATTLPSTVRKDRSLFVQIACSAIVAASRN